MTKRLVAGLLVAIGLTFAGGPASAVSPPAPPPPMDGTTPYTWDPGNP